jgi:hypothetical protein
MRGIVPAELLLVSVSGSSLTYQNVAAMPTRSSRDAATASSVGDRGGSLDLLPRTQVVRFSFDELRRLAEPEAINTYAALTPVSTICQRSGDGSGSLSRRTRRFRPRSPTRTVATDPRMSEPSRPTRAAISRGAPEEERTIEARIMRWGETRTATGLSGSPAARSGERIRVPSLEAIGAHGQEPGVRLVGRGPRSRSATTRLRRVPRRQDTRR